MAIKEKFIKIRLLLLFGGMLVTNFLIGISTALADCADYMAPGDFPDEIISPNGTTLKFTYQLGGNNESYSYSWSKGSVHAGPVGPFALQPGCKIPQVAHENNEFLLLEKGCGSFCWYFEVLGLGSAGTPHSGTYVTIDRPLAFDAGRNFVAYYPEKDVIAIRNLLTGYEQTFPTAYECDSWSGLCFSDVTFAPDRLQYRWDSPAGDRPGETLDHTLDQALLENR